MNKKEIDAGTLAMLVKRFNLSTLPRAERMLEHVQAGEKLSSYDIQWLKKIYKDGRMNQCLAKRHPEYWGLISRFADLYSEITTIALENEKAG